MSQNRLPQRIMAVALPYLPTDNLARRKWGKSWRLAGRPEASPLVLTDTIRNAIRVVALEAGASSLGLSVGQTLSDARALAPDLDCAPHDAAQLKAVLLSVAGWCERYTPLVAISGTDGLFLDITGCAHLFGGEAAMVKDIRSRLQAQGFVARVAIADTPGAAWGMARHGTEMLVAPGRQGAALAPLPLEALRLPEDTVTSLGRVGFKTVGCIASLPRAPLARRFGTDLLRRLDQALGVEDEILSPLMPVADLTSEKRLTDAIRHEEDIRHVIGVLASNMAPALERRGLGARHCELKLFRVDGHVQSLSVNAANPSRDPHRIAALFRERLTALHDDLDAGFGFDVLRLSVLQADPLSERQEDFTAGPGESGDYALLIDRLAARLGNDKIRRFVHADTHIPERSFSLSPLQATRPQNQAGSYRDMAELLVEHYGEGLTRPLLLLERPEQVDAVAHVPDGPPIRFRWRKALYETVHSEGPERIACEWWRDGRHALSRDYFRVEDRDGHRFWLFRHGLYARETNHPHWYMHGIFA